MKYLKTVQRQYYRKSYSMGGTRLYEVVANVARYVLVARHNVIDALRRIEEI